MANESDVPHEIVIVRRRHEGDHDEAHGGVWKVAFADFMTAMMAFFLVLWIVNSTSKETRASVARYFNPVRLSDTTPARKGLQEAREEDFDASVKATEQKPSAQPSGRETKPSSEKASTQIPQAAFSQSPSNRPTSAQSVSVAFRDPFESGKPTQELAPAKSPGGEMSYPNDKTTSPEQPALMQAVAALAREAQGRHGPALTLRETSEGMLISLTDKADYGMFGIGSTDPNAGLIRLVTELGGILKMSKNLIVVRGYTDARRYRKAGFDNWRLSTGRAQIACDMLLRGGVDEQRIDRIEGYADHNLRNAREPEAAENRRVEILLRKETR